MNINVDDINRDALDNFLTVEDNNEDIGNDDTSINTLLHQLLSATTSLQSSVDAINVKMIEMKNQQRDMQTNISHIEKVVFSAETLIRRLWCNKARLGF